MNLGDFCVPHARNDRFLAAFDRFAGLKLHVLGNHDTDGGFKRDETRAFWNSPVRSFSRDEHGRPRGLSGRLEQLSRGPRGPRAAGSGRVAA